MEIFVSHLLCLAKLNIFATTVWYITFTFFISVKKIETVYLGVSLFKPPTYCKQSTIGFRPEKNKNMAANMEHFLQFLIAVGYLPIRQDGGGVWRQDLRSAKFLALLVIFLLAVAGYLYTMWSQFQLAGQSIASITGLILQVL